MTAIRNSRGGAGVKLQITAAESQTVSEIAPRWGRWGELNLKASRHGRELILDVARYSSGGIATI